MKEGKPTKEEVIQDLQNEKEMLGNMTFGVNITHPLPLSVSSSLDELWSVHDPHSSHYYHNITGIFRGEWKNRNISIPDTANMTEIDEARSKFKFDGPATFTLQLKSFSTELEDANYIEGYIRIRDAEKSDSGVLLMTGGVHFLNNGSLYLMAVPNGLSIPLEDLLNMLQSNASFVDTRKILVEQIDKKIEELDKSPYWDWEVNDESAYPPSFYCQFQMFAQLNPVPKEITQSDLLDYEKELADPQGISTVKPPPLLLSAELYSPNCQLLLSIDKEPGIKIEKYYRKAVAYAGMATAIAIIQIFALIHQMEFTPTPSSVSNVSYWTIAIQAVMDGYLCLLHLTTGVVIENVFIPFATAAFFTFILVSIFGMRYLLVVWRIQRPESIRPTVSEQQQQQQQQEESTDASENTLPTANIRRPPTTTTEEVSPYREVTYLYYRLYAILLLGLFLFYQSITRSAFIQNVILGTLGIFLYSFWVPQIVRNIWRGCRRPLSHTYILVMSITRLSIPLYFYGCPTNLIGHETSSWIWVIVAYVGLQVVILFLQDAFGPRLVVPSRYLPDTYDYHPILTTNIDEETVQQEIGQPKDCAICMLPVDIANHGHSGLNVLARANYMMTPCHHLFHTECLERWMRIKLECPVCRAYLPAC
ncbi:hypothetical protein G6F70_004731 [Rhizopus microsporus]|uniref:RING-type E3 ubiquitin transferase n=2 Tax=Rhizopus TaxID=4842 RepID=A0A367J667_RHIAZ|nr:hypothetical protein G6F71_004747 [Rhizopus microsporus]RCH85428.1 hypothetical protein CU097_006582 [Rhizopus azygosporus]KAG1199647.1 hypothetical protein G6F70_004731 [Rhizopus microsporus]KAG1211406.1 hypothetical protein G6F69_004612 [Rhizopus microsporus]KAG1233284.1 hypothetical protein G6F67_004375 [Rhizopus microsporus]